MSPDALAGRWPVKAETRHAARQALDVGDQSPNLVRWVLQHEVLDQPGAAVRIFSIGEVDAHGGGSKRRRRWRRPCALARWWRSWGHGIGNRRGVGGANAGSWRRSEPALRRAPWEGRLAPGHHLGNGADEPHVAGAATQ